MKSASRALGMVVLLAGAASCDEDTALAPSTYFPKEGQPVSRDFPAPEPYANPACNVEDGSLAGEREMHLYASGSVDVVTLTRGLARYYQRHGLQFFTPSSAQAAGTSYALDTNERALGNALALAFPGVDLNDEAALMADPVRWNQIVTFAANFMLRPMIDFARAHGTIGQGVTNFVVVPDLERPGGTQLGEPGTSLVGLAVSTHLLDVFAATMTEEGAIWNGVALPPDFTPMMFLGHNIIRSKTSRFPEIRDLVVAHEFGHASGLEHTDVSRNLMFPAVTPGLNTCLDGLTEEQLATMRTTLGVGAAAASGALTNRAAATSGLPRPSPEARRLPRFTPADLRGVLAGDGRAMERLLAPFIHPVVLREPLP